MRTIDVNAMRTVSVAICLISAPWVYAQAPLPEFEVASVKPDARLGPLPMHSYSSGAFTAVHMVTRDIIAVAYGVPRDLISGGPSWINSEAFDIEARAQASTEQSQVKLMLQALLEDRFKLKVRRETKDLPISYMTMPKPSSKLVPAKDAERAGLVWAPDYVAMLKTSMQDLAVRLRPVVGHTVIDKTGIAGEFDFHVDASPDSHFQSEADAYLALIYEVGLKLETTKGPTETIIIESIERPSAN